MNGKLPCLSCHQHCKPKPSVPYSVYSTVRALGLVPASTIPRDGTGWYKA